MTVAEISDYLITLEREGFTGQVILNYHKGDISKKVQRKITEDAEKSK